MSEVELYANLCSCKEPGALAMGTFCPCYMAGRVATQYGEGFCKSCAITSICCPCYLGYQRYKLMKSLGLSSGCFKDVSTGFFAGPCSVVQLHVQKVKMLAEEAASKMVAPKSQVLVNGELHDVEMERNSKGIFVAVPKPKESQVANSSQVDAE